MAARLRLDINQGETFRKPFVWKSGGVPVNLTGYTARMQIRSDVDSPTIITSLTTENGGITVGNTDGAFALYISAADTALLNFDQGVYDVELVSASGDVRRIIQGDVYLSPEVTR